MGECVWKTARGIAPVPVGHPAPPPAPNPAPRLWDGRPCTIAWVLLCACACGVLLMRLCVSAALRRTDSPRADHVPGVRQPVCTRRAGALHRQSPRRPARQYREPRKQCVHWGPLRLLRGAADRHAGATGDHRAAATQREAQQSAPVPRVPQRCARCVSATVCGLRKDGHGCGGAGSVSAPFAAALAAAVGSLTSRACEWFPWPPLPQRCVRAVVLLAGEVPDIQIKLKDLLDPMQVRPCRLPHASCLLTWVNVASHPAVATPRPYTGNIVNCFFVAFAAARVPPRLPGRRCVSAAPRWPGSCSCPCSRCGTACVPCHHPVFLCARVACDERRPSLRRPRPSPPPLPSPCRLTSPCPLPPL